MKDNFAASCFTLALAIVCGLSIVGLSFGARIPFIPSETAHAIAVYWIPPLMAIGWLLALAFHRSASDPLRRRRLIVLYLKYGPVKASLGVFFFTIFFYAISYAFADGGIPKSAVFLSGVLPSKDVVVEVPIYGIRDFSTSITSLMWVKIDNQGHTDDFSYPKSKLTFLPCANDRIRISGSASWAGIKVNHVECSPPDR